MLTIIHSKKVERIKPPAFKRARHKETKWFESLTTNRRCLPRRGRKRRMKRGRRSRRRKEEGGQLRRHPLFFFFLFPTFFFAFISLSLSLSFSLSLFENRIHAYNWSYELIASKKSGGGNECGRPQTYRLNSHLSIALSSRSQIPPARPSSALEPSPPPELPITSRRLDCDQTNWIGRCAMFEFIAGIGRQRSPGATNILLKC